MMSGPRSCTSPVNIRFRSRNEQILRRDSQDRWFARKRLSGSLTSNVPRQAPGPGRPRPPGVANFDRAGPGSAGGHWHRMHLQAPFSPRTGSGSGARVVPASRGGLAPGGRGECPHRHGSSPFLLLDENSDAWIIGARVDISWHDLRQARTRKPAAAAFRKLYSRAYSQVFATYNQTSESPLACPLYLTVLHVQDDVRRHGLRATWSRQRGSMSSWAAMFGELLLAGGGLDSGRNGSPAGRRGIRGTVWSPWSRSVPEGRHLHRCCGQESSRRLRIPTSTGSRPGSTWAPACSPATPGADPRRGDPSAPAAQGGTRLAHAYSTSGRPAEAITLYGQTVADSGRQLGLGHPVTMSAGRPGAA